MILIFVILAALALSAAAYGWLEPAPDLRGAAGLRRNLVPFVGRWLAWAALGVLLTDLSCARDPTGRRPLVLLDASLSMAADSGRWTEALDSARRTGEVRYFGDERLVADSLPTRGRSLLRPGLEAAAASDRPVVVLTDAELDDLADIPSDLLGRATIRVFARRPGEDRALTRVEAPRRVTTGDSVPLSISIRSFGEPGGRGEIVVTAGDRPLARDSFVLAGGSATARIVLPGSALRPGPNLLTVSLAGNRDAEPRDDRRLVLVQQSAAPGVVLLADPGDWDSRFLYRALVDVAQLPVRGYIQLVPGEWRDYANLRPVPAAQVNRAARDADLLVMKGSTAAAGQSRARGLWRWPDLSAPGALEGDWYLSARPLSPVAGAFTGLPVDSFPPATRIGSAAPDSSAWIAMTAQLGRRGAERPVWFGRQRGDRREVTTIADGLWRWTFRGGSSEQAYRSLIAATASWLLAGADSATGQARPVQPVVANGRPVVFEWLGPESPRSLPVTFTGSADRRDTLTFDGGGRALAWLPAGRYQYRIEGGGSGTVAVEEYSDEWLPGPPLLENREARTLAVGTLSRARGWLWLFGLVVVGLAVEWMGRRRLGLR